MEKNLDRRNFLKKTLLGAASVAVLHDLSKSALAQADLFSQINRVKDTQNMSLLEEKHSPVITAPKNIKAGEPFEVQIEIGRVAHPMERAHYINWLQLFADEIPIATVSFQPVVSRPEATLTVILEKATTLRVLESCNLHGVWESRLDISI
jgi:superoxide reductase